MTVELRFGTAVAGWSDQDLLDALVASNEGSPDGFMVLEGTVGQGFAIPVVFVSDQLCELTGRCPEDVIGQPIGSVFGTRVAPTDLERVTTDISSGGRTGLTVRVVHTDGTPRDLEMTVTPRALHSGRLRCSVVVRDVTRLHDAHRMIKAILETMSDSFIALDRDLRIRAVSEHTRLDLAAYRAPRSLIGKSFFDAFPDTVGTSVEDDLRRALEERVAVRYEWQGSITGAQIDVRVLPVTDGLVLFYQVVSEARRAREALRQAAERDPLTGLLNRGTFTRRLQRLLDGRVRPAILLLDVDHLKTVNDLHGHEAGDDLLVAVAQRLEQVTRVGEVPARLGGDEFVVCAAVRDEADAAALAERLRDALVTEPVAVGGLEMAVSVSVGVACGRPADTPDSLMRDADTALYAAKRAGRNRIRLFDDALRGEVRRRRATETELGAAVAAGTLVVHYQPVWDLAAGQRRALEAVVRWPRPGGTLEVAERFVPLIEDSELIDALGRVVLADVCSRLQAWRASPTPVERVWMNASTRDLTRPSFAEDVLVALDDHRAPSTALGVSVTETRILVESEVARANLVALRAAGIAVGIDDFGTGWSSLRGVADLAPDVIEIDRSFVAAIPRDPTARSVVEAVVTLARSLGALSLAEGVEHPEQLRILRGIGCRLASGNLLGAPVAADELDDDPPAPLRELVGRQEALRLGA